MQSLCRRLVAFQRHAGGHIDVAFDNVPNVLQQVKAGTLRALGVSSAKRSPLTEIVPTVVKAGVANCEVRVWFGVVGPAHMPPDVARKLNAEINAILKYDDVKRRFADQGVEPVGGTPAPFADHIKVEIAKWAKVVREAGIKPD